VEELLDLVEAFTKVAAFHFLIIHFMEMLEETVNM
jgi:hypothetical protein